MRYRIENRATRAFAFRTTAGMVMVGRDDTREIEMPEPMPDARIGDLARKGVTVREAHAFTEAVSAPETGESAAGPDDAPEDLFARAQALGLSPSPRWKPDTLRRKIAEAEGA